MLLTTPRLTLSPFTPSDWPFFLALRQNADNMRFMGQIAGEAEIRIQFDARLANSNAFVIRFQGNDAPLGEIGLRVSPGHPDAADIGYSVVKAAQGKGIASEALEAVCHHGLHTVRLEAIHAWVLAGNAGSVRVLEKLGFERIQVLEKAMELNGVFHDDWMFRLKK